MRPRPVWKPDPWRLDGLMLLVGCRRCTSTRRRRRGHGRTARGMLCMHVDVSAVLVGPAASPQCAAYAPSEAWLGQRLTTWRIGLRVFGRFGRSLAGCASRVGSVGGVVDGRAQPVERLPRAPLGWVDGDGGGVELRGLPR